MVKLCIDINLLLQMSMPSMASTVCGEDGPQEFVAKQQVWVAQNTTYSDSGRGSKVQYRCMSESQECKDYIVFTDYDI